MIKRIVFFCMMVYSADSYTQNLAIRYCRQSPTDSTHIVSPRRDINDRLCSVVKVFTKNVNGKIDFKGNVVGNVIDNGNEYIVYVLERTKRLQIFHADYIPEIIDFTKYEDSKMGVEIDRVYHVEISGEEQQESSNLVTSTETRILSFTSDKQMSQLFVNGKEWEILNNASKKLLPCGKYEYEAVSFEGLRIKDTIELSPAFGRKIVKIDFVK